LFVKSLSRNCFALDISNVKKFVNQLRWLSKIIPAKYELELVYYLYQVCLKSNGNVQCTLQEKLLSQRKKHCFLWCHNVLWFWKPNFSILWQLHSFFARFLCQGTFFV